MAVSSILLPSLNTEVIRQVTDTRSLAYGGYFGSVIPDRDRNHSDLYEFDATVTSAANIVARGATNVDATRQVNNVVNNRAVQLVRSEAFTQEEMEIMAMVGNDADTPAIRARLASMANRVNTRNGEGLVITRGYLASSMAVGEITWSHLGFVADSIGFRMPSVMKYTPGTYWRSGVAGSTYNAGATPLQDKFGLDYQASILGNAPFDMIGSSYNAYLAATGTDEYKARAIEVSGIRAVTGLPNPQSPGGMDLAKKVFGVVDWVWLDQTFQREQIGGARETVRYTPEDVTVLWRKSDENNNANWEMSNVPLTKSMVAEVTKTLGVANGLPNPFGGIVRGPVAWPAADTQEYTHSRLLAAWEGFPLRRTLGVTAVIYNRARS